MFKSWGLRIINGPGGLQFLSGSGLSVFESQGGGLCCARVLSAVRIWLHMVMGGSGFGHWTCCFVGLWDFELWKNRECL